MHPLSECQKSPKSSKPMLTIWDFFSLSTNATVITQKYLQKRNSLLRKGFDLRHNSPHSCIHIHIGVELLAFGPLLTSVRLSKNKFFDSLRGGAIAPPLNYTAFQLLLHFLHGVGFLPQGAVGASLPAPGFSPATPPHEDPLQLFAAH